ncbi:hypothetical protein CTEN210_13038 [Chaetoceros tenuissimus]|uniref:Hexosyltransferase n=1 Tax=Chaetoceros tenuissimus TaxID=426638 RepID=A0AAD3D298_9STRA|nr:hypothetical protein CTEN210_13038 [Chaetoceros tenuissimus]
MPRFQLFQRKHTGVAVDNQRKKKHALLMMICSLALAMMYSSLSSTASTFDRQLSKGFLQRFLKQPFSKQPRYYNVAHRSKVLIGIFSTSGIEKYDHRREYIRETFVNSAEEHLCSLNEYLNTIESTRANAGCEIIYTFVIGAGDSDRPTDHGDDEPLTLPYDQHGKSEPDCTYLNIRENIEQGKSATWLKYASLIGRQYGFDYVMKVDDDTVLTVPQLVQFTREELPPVPYNTRIYGGPPRPSRSANTLYAAGELYFMSLDLAYYVGNELTAQDRVDMRTAKRPVEDLDMGTYIYSHPYPIKFLNMYRMGIWTHEGRTKEEENYRMEWNTRRIEEGLPVHPDSQWKQKAKHNSIYYDSIYYDAVHHDVSNPIAKKTKVLIGIFSASGIEKYDHRREYIRETAVNPEEEHLCSLQEYMYRVDHNEKGIEIDCEIIYTFVIGGANDFERPEDHGDDEPLTLTQDRHDNSEADCTYLNIRENMEEGKLATWFKYASQIGYQYGIDYVMKADDDTVLTIPQLVQFTRDELPPVPYKTTTKNKKKFIHTQLLFAR